jgi:hypothetical protein
MPAGRRGPGWHLPGARTGGTSCSRELAGRPGSPHHHLAFPGKPGTLELSEWQGQAWSSIAINLDLNARPITSYGALVIVFARIDC